MSNRCTEEVPLAAGEAISMHARERHHCKLTQPHDDRWHECDCGTLFRLGTDARTVRPGARTPVYVRAITQAEYEDGNHTDLGAILGEIDLGTILSEGRSTPPFYVLPNVDGTSTVMPIHAPTTPEDEARRKALQAVVDAGGVLTQAHWEFRRQEPMAWPEGWRPLADPGAPALGIDPPAAIYDQEAPALGLPRFEPARDQSEAPDDGRDIFMGPGVEHMPGLEPWPPTHPHVHMPHRYGVGRSIDITEIAHERLTKYLNAANPAMTHPVTHDHYPTAHVQWAKDHSPDDAGDNLKGALVALAHAAYKDTPTTLCGPSCPECATRTEMTKAQALLDDYEQRTPDAWEHIYERGQEIVDRLVVRPHATQSHVTESEMNEVTNSDGHPMTDSDGGEGLSRNATEAGRQIGRAHV